MFEALEEMEFSQFIKPLKDSLACEYDSIRTGLYTLQLGRGYYFALLIAKCEWSEFLLLTSDPSNHNIYNYILGIHNNFSVMKLYLIFKRNIQFIIKCYW